MLPFCPTTFNSYSLICVVGPQRSAFLLCDTSVCWHSNKSVFRLKLAVYNGEIHVFIDSFWCELIFVIFLTRLEANHDHIIKISFLLVPGIVWHHLSVRSRPSSAQLKNFFFDLVRVTYYTKGAQAIDLVDWCFKEELSDGSRSDLTSYLSPLFCMLEAGVRKYPA